MAQRSSDTFRRNYKTGQVNIQVRDVKGWGDNPFSFEEVKKILKKSFPNMVTE